MTNQLLIPVFNGTLQNQQAQLVDARLLHEFLDVKKHFASWVTERIKEYKFIENQDFISFSQNRVKPTGGRPTIEYHISLDMAKELSMIEKTDRGRQARKYFIACEKQLRSADPNAIAGRLEYSRFVLSFDADMQVALQPLPFGSTMIATRNAKQLQTLINEMVPIDLLPDLLRVGIDRLSR